MKDTERDFLAVQEDALLIDFVATRQDLTAFADDHIAQLLGTYAADVDEGLDLLANAELPEAPAILTPRSRAAGAPRRSARFLVAATTAVVLVGTSGVAAAVTGDPLSPFRSVVKVVTGGGDAPSADPVRKSDELPEPAPTKAEAALTLNDVQQALRDGDVERAQRLLDELRSDGKGTVELPPGLDARVDKLQDKVDGAPEGVGNGGNQGQNDRDRTKHENNGTTSHPNQPGQGDEQPNKPGQDNNGGKKDDASTGNANNEGTGANAPGDRGQNPDNGSGGGTNAGGQRPGQQSGNGGGQAKGRPDRAPDKPENGNKPDKPEPPAHGNESKGNHKAPR